MDLTMFPTLLAQEASPGTGETAGSLLEQFRQEYLSADQLLDMAAAWGPRLLAAVAVFVVGRWFIRIIIGMIIRAGRRAGTDETLLGFLRHAVHLLLLVIVCIAALSCLGVDTTSLSAVLAAAGFAVGMAMQGSLGNIASGVMLVVFKPFRVGDYVDLSGVAGTVVEIQMFSTVLVTPDNVRVVVPNANITGSAISNFSAEKSRRIDLTVDCGYSDDLKAVRAFLQDLVDSDPRILRDPEPVVAVSELADSSVRFVVRPWVDRADYWAVRFDLTERIKLGFDERGFTFPFPSRDVFMHQPDAA